MYRVRNLVEQYARTLDLQIESGEKGLDRKIHVPEAHRPGLSLSGYLKNHAYKRILVFGRVEVNYLKDLKREERLERLSLLLVEKTPAVIIARNLRPPKELIEICNQKQLPLFRSGYSTMTLLNKLSLLLSEEFSESISCHGTLVEVFGVGVLIEGDSSVGKSEAALGLIERGHRLISDDVVRIKKKGSYLEGSGTELTKHLMEIRGIGIINVAHLYGAVCVRDSKSIDIVVKLEQWDEDTFYDRVGLDDEDCEILGLKLPHHLLPVKPGRDVVLLLETIALNWRLRGMGYHSAKEFSQALIKKLTAKQRRGVGIE